MYVKLISEIISDILMQIMTKLSYQKKKNIQTFNFFKLKIAFIPYISKNLSHDP